jgi:hypothetical protein
VTYLAVVKYAIDAPAEEKRRALVEGVSNIAMELVAEHDYTPATIETLFEDAHSDAQYEYELKREREEG